MRAQGHVGQCAGGAEEFAHLMRHAHPDGVGQRDLAGAGGRRPRDESRDRVGRHLALEGAAERGRDRHRRRHPGRAGEPEHLLHHRGEGVGGGVLVAQVEGVAGGDDQVDLVDAGVQGAQEAAPVEHQPDVRHVVTPGHLVHHLLGVGHLRHGVRADEGDRLHPAHPGRDRQFDEADLVLGGEDRRLVLQAVAGADLDHLDRPGRLLRRTHRARRLRHALTSAVAPRAGRAVPQSSSIRVAARYPSRTAVR